MRKTLKKYFVPHEENDHKPHLLRPRTVAFVLLIAIAAEGALWVGTSILAPRSELFGLIVANVLVDETNQNRTTNNDHALTVSPLLTAAAQEKANDMVANNYFAHTSPTGVTPWYWFEKVGYNFTYAGENLAVNFSDSQDVTNAWMNSPDHRANILNSDFTQIGIATAQGTFEGHPATYVVELFGTPVRPAPPGEPIVLAKQPSAKATIAKVARAITTVAQASTTLATTTPTTTPTVVAIAGASTTNNASSAVLGATEDSAAPKATAKISVQTNPVQKAAANPRALIDFIYFAVIALFAVALGINVFVKIRIQHPQLIFGGMLVILVAGLLVVLNVHALAGAAIL